jgi:fructose-1,6-bisphosphatase II
MQNRSFETNLAVELTRVTEEAAIAAARWMGRGDVAASNHAAVDAIRSALNDVDMDGVVVVGEGERNEAPLLYVGESLGNGHPSQVDIGVNAIDGVTLLTAGLPNAISVVALTERGQMQRPQAITYMDKIAVGREACGAIDITASPSQNLRWVAKAKGCAVADLTVVVLDRPRNDRIVAEVRSMGARIQPISGGDVAGAIMTALPDTGADILFGIGGASEAVLAAAALKCLGGELQCRLWTRDEAERTPAVEAGLDFNRVYTIEDLVGNGDTLFAATGVTDGQLLKGVKYFGGGESTQSLVLHSGSGAVRWITTHHLSEPRAKYPT